MSCSYQHRRAGLQRHWPSSHSNSSSVQNRMDRLEQLVVTMMNQKEGSATDSSIDRVVPYRDVQVSRYEVQKDEVPRPSDSTKSRMLRIDADYGNSYTVGETHWSALLNEVRYLQGLYPRSSPILSPIDSRGTRLPSDTTKTIRGPVTEDLPAVEEGTGRSRPDSTFWEFSIIGSW